MKALPPAAAVLAAGAGWLCLGPLGLLAALVVPASLVLPRPYRVWPTLAWALLPIPAIGSVAGAAALLLLAGALLATVFSAAGLPGREGAVAAAALVVLFAGAFAAIPRARFFFEADAGLATFLLGGAALASLGLAALFVPLGSDGDEEMQPPVG